MFFFAFFHWKDFKGMLAFFKNMIALRELFRWAVTVFWFHYTYHKWFLLAFVVICDRGKDLKPNNSRSQCWWENRSNLMAKGNTTYRLNVFTRLWFPLAEITRKFHYVKVFFLPWWFRQNLWWKDPWGLFNSRQAQGTSDPPSKSEN